MEKSEQTFLDAILAEPENDLARLAYAEWLTRRGDPRGEFITIQCELRARHGQYDARISELQKRERALRDEHLAAWEAPFKAVKVLVNWDRGFPYSFICGAAEFLRARSLVLSTPLRSVTLMGDVKPSLPELVLSPELGHVTSLSLSCGRRADRTTQPMVLGDAAFAGLIGSPHLSNLRALDLGWNDIGVAGLEALASAPFITRLESLVSGDNSLGPSGVAALAARLESIRSLNLWGAEVGDVGAAALAARRTPGLTLLRLVACHVGEAGAVALAASRSLAKLTLLDLSSNAIHDVGAVALAGSTEMPLLRELRLSLNAIGDAGAAALAVSPERAALFRLALDTNRIGPAGAKALADSTTLRALDTLELGENPLEAAGVDALAAGNGLPALTAIGVARTVYTSEIEHYSDWDGSDTTVSGPRPEDHSELKQRFANKPNLRLV